MKPKIWISELTFSDGTKIPLNKDAITVIVGANNSGKSASLKEIVALLKVDNSDSTKVIKNIQFQKEGTEDEFADYLKYLSSSISDGSNGPRYKGYQVNVERNPSIYHWKSAKNINYFHAVFVNILNTESRINAANPAENINFQVDVPNHPIHFLYRDDTLESKFSEYFKQAFGFDLVVHRNMGKVIPLYVGKRPIPKEGEDRLSSNYIKELEKLDLLQEQGDGMRSFVGVLLNTFIANYSMQFIDEPEAFLHAPQARLLGKMLAKDLPSDRQLFIATHSEDFIKGLLDTNFNRLNIIRIQRQENINHVSLLNNIEIQEVWNDSLLRHSNILSGLFHSEVIICESESDSRFYSAVLLSLYDETGLTIPDDLFINCGGKHRIPTVIKALKKLNVPIKIVVDFDVLNDTNPLKNIYEELGGSWPEIERNWKIVKGAIDQKRPELEKNALKDVIDEIFKNTAEAIMPNDKVKALQSALRKTSAWTEAKGAGKAFIPNGDATKAFDELQSTLKSKGIFVLEVGELEGFVKSVGGHGPKWVNDVLTKDLKNDKELETARQFVKELIETKVIAPTVLAEPPILAALAG